MQEGGRKKGFQAPLLPKNRKKSNRLVRDIKWYREGKTVRQKLTESKSQRWRKRDWEKEEEAWGQENTSDSTLTEAVAL